LFKLIQLYRNSTVFTTFGCSRASSSKRRSTIQHCLEW